MELFWQVILAVVVAGLFIQNIALLVGRRNDQEHFKMAWRDGLRVGGETYRDVHRAYLEDRLARARERRERRNGKT